MGKTIMYGVVSADGYVARPDGQVGPFFDWFGSGDVAWNWNGVELRTAQASKDFIQAVYDRHRCDGGRAVRVRPDQRLGRSGRGR